MQPKPASCKGCPFYQTGTGFVPDERHEQAPVVIYGQNPGAEEERDGVPFVGKTGEMMMRSFFPIAGLQRGRVTIANAVRCRVNRANDLPDLEATVMREAIEHCTGAHWQRPEGARLIVTQGDRALYAMTGEGVAREACRIKKCVCKRRGVGDWRGWVLPYNPPPWGAKVLADVYEPTPSDVKVLATYHLAYLFRDASAMTPTQMDWRKVPFLLKGTWPERIPPIDELPPRRWPQEAAFDTEFTRETGKLIRYSLGWRDEAGAHLHVVEADDHELVEIARPAEAPRVVMHNAEADLPHLPWVLGDHFQVEDTMYSAAVLWSELDKDLDFCASLYARTNRWKHLVHTNPRVYAGGDALGTWDIWRAHVKEFDRDSQSRWVYEHVMRPLIPIISRARRHGFAVHPQFRDEAHQVLAARAQDAQWQAQAAVGWPINLASPAQVAHQIYQVEKARERGYRRPGPWNPSPRVSKSGSPLSKTSSST